MVFIKSIYCDEKINRKKDKIIKKLKKGSLLLSTFLIIIGEGSNQLEIIDSVYLRQPHYKGKEVVVVGISSSKKDALDIVTTITSEVYKATSNANIKDYIREGM